MNPLLLSKSQIAELMGLTPDVARATLVGRGINPVDFGPGRGRGLRWYAAAVEQVVAEMHADAQIKRSTQRNPKRSKPSSVSLASMTTSDIFELTSRHAVQ